MSTTHTSTPRTIPISLLPPTAIVPLDYLVHIHSHCCQLCGAVHQHSEVFAHNAGHIWTARYTAGRKLVENLTPIVGFHYNLPIRVMRLAPKPVPCCHECVDRISLAALPDPESPHHPLHIAPPKATESGGANTGANRPARKSLTPSELLNLL